MYCNIKTNISESQDYSRKEKNNLTKVYDVTYIPLLQKDGVGFIQIFMQVCREGTENCSTAGMDINLFL